MLSHTVLPSDPSASSSPCRRHSKAGPFGERVYVYAGKPQAIGVSTGPLAVEPVSMNKNTVPRL